MKRLRLISKRAKDPFKLDVLIDQLGWWFLWANWPTILCQPKNMWIVKKRLWQKYGVHH